MPEEKKEKENCPLCSISEETIERLKNRGPLPFSSETKVKKKFSLKFKALLLIFVLGLTSFIFFKFFERFNPLSENKANSNNNLNFSSGAIEVGESAPDFISEDVEGNKISLSDFQNKKPVLLVFWATWCSSCAQELPDLKSFTQVHQTHIQVIAIPSREARKTIKNYIRKEEVNFLMLLDEKRDIWNQYLVRGTPTHFLIDSKGEIVSLRPGLASKKDLEIFLTMLPEL